MRKRKRIVSCGYVRRCVTRGALKEKNTNPTVQSIKKLHFVILYMILITGLRKNNELEQGRQG